MPIRRILRLLILGRKRGLRSRLWSRFGFRAGEPAAPEPPAAAPPPPVVGAPPPVASLREGWVSVLASASLAEGKLVEAFMDGKPIALARVDGKVHAMSNVCPHAGGPIGDGTLEGHTVTCPYHGWAYDVRDGRCHVNPEVRLPILPAEEVDGAVCVGPA